MKAKKAMKRLHRIETLLGTVIDRYDPGTSEVQALLAAARTSVASATHALAAPPAKKAPAKAHQTKARRLSDAARKRLSAAAKMRWAAAKRKGISTLAKSTLKTA